ncbi:MAG: CotH kinase family protein [Crocinitomicaceae bacterium]|jgi:subtilisin-like proprotein convertase family protein|nr:CotH kinase family protein [Crocinitomicaceae bacterium]
MKLLLTVAGFMLSTIGISQTFSGGTGPILDNQTIDIPLIVLGLPTSINTTSFGLEEICIDLNHTYLNDLTVSLLAPDGTLVELFSSVGGGDDDMQVTCLRSDAANPLSSGSAPYNGTFQPMGQMGLANNGQNPNGTWYLRIHDGAGADEGVLNTWNLTFGSSPADYFQFSESDLPIVVINTNGQSIPDEPKILADMGIIYNGPGVRNYMTNPMNEYDGRIGIERRGNYSASLPQKPYALKLQDNLGNQIDSSLIGMPAEHDWLLVANYNDKSFARNIIPYHIFDEIGHYAPRTKLVDVVLNGEYKGIYLLTEKIKRDANRVDVDDLYPFETAPPDVTGGYILKVDYWDNQNSWQLANSPIDHPTFDIHMVYVYPKVVNIVGAQTNFIQNYVDQFETALYGPNFADPINGFRKYISTRSWLDYFIVNELARNGDGFKKSRYFNKEKDHSDGSLGKLKAGPVWDFDWAWKDMWDCMYDATDGSEWAYKVNDCNPDVSSPGWFVRMFEDPIFQDEMRCRYEDLRRNVLSESYLHGLVDSVANVVDESQEWHYLTWGHMGAATGTPEVPAPAQTYAEEVQRLKDWITRRLDWLDLNIPGTLNGCSMTGIAEITNEPKVESYPNPFRTDLSLSAEHQPLACTIRILDQAGRLIKLIDVEPSDWVNNALKIDDLNDLTTGIYLFEISLDGKTTIKKLTKF